jgi:hypothetical protein
MAKTQNRKAKTAVLGTRNHQCNLNLKLLVAKSLILQPQMATA